MSNKFALSDTKSYAGKQFNFTAGFTGKMPSETEKSTSAPSDELNDARVDERDQEESDDIALPSHVAGSGTLDLSRDCAAPLTTYRVAKENAVGITTDRGIPCRSRARVIPPILRGCRSRIFSAG